MNNYTAALDALGIHGRISGVQLVGRCPLHHDNHPSFSVNIQNGLWICYAGCGSGNTEQLVERVLGVSPKEAEIWVREHLSDGVVLTEEQMRDIVIDAYRSEAEPPPPQITMPDWKSRYLNLPEHTMPIWFFARGFVWQTVDNWKIRWDEGNEQLVIPIYCGGDLVGTVSRNSPGVMPKYINSPGLEKSQVLFGLPQDKVDTIIIVEGPMDAMWLWGIGQASVALLGLTISPAQVSLLQQAGVGTIILAMDNDSAGEEAKYRHAKMLVKQGWLPSLILAPEYPDGAKDVQDCSLWQVRDMIHNAKPIIGG